MVTQLEARAAVADKERTFSHLYQQPDHLEYRARMIAPLMAWALFFAVMLLGDFLTELSQSSAVAQIAAPISTSSAAVSKAARDLRLSDASPNR
jgi:hypothetical protein